jgi:hypothetical protein
MSGLLVPADSAVPLSLCAVEDSATAISDLLGGVLLDDACVLPLTDGTSVSVYQSEDRASLPVNDRLTVLATRLGIVDRAFHAAARGDALVLGTTRQDIDVDVPATVIMAADRCGYQIAILCLVDAPSPRPGGQPTDLSRHV